MKPLYLLKEEEVEKYSKLKKFPINYDICPCSVGAYRREHKEILDEYEKKHPDVKYNVIRFHESMKDSLKKEKSVKIAPCKYCGEPSSSGICKTCSIFNELKSIEKEK
ncbi:TIGR00269 family protein [Nanoarchaeota archaeon]